MNKEVCKACKLRHGMRWNKEDEKNWDRGMVLCRPSDHTDGYYSVRTPSREITDETLPPKRCRFPTEQVVLSQNSVLSQ